MSNRDLVDAWKDENENLLKNLSDYKSIMRHIDSAKFINSDKKIVALYLKNVYAKISESKNIPDIHSKQNVDMEYLADKVNSIAVSIDRVSDILNTVLYNDDKISKTYEDFGKLFDSLSGVGGEIRKAVRMLKARLGYDILTPTDKDRIYQTDEFRAILEECTGAGGSFDECMDTSLNKFLEERGLI